MVRIAENVNFLGSKRKWVKLLILEVYNVFWRKKYTYNHVFSNNAELVEIYKLWAMNEFETAHGYPFDEKNKRFFLFHRSIMGCIKLGWCCFIYSYYSRPIQQLVTHTNILPKLFVSNCLQTVVFLCVNLINKNIQGQSWWSLSSKDDCMYSENN